MNEQRQPPTSSASRSLFLAIRVSSFDLPPVRDALIVGRRAPIGAQSLARALDDISPGSYRLIPVEHEIIEAVLVREVLLRKVPQEVLIPRLLAYGEAMADHTEVLHFEIRLEVQIREQIDLP